MFLRHPILLFQFMIILDTSLEFFWGRWIVQLVSDLDVLNSRRRIFNRPCEYGMLLLVQTSDGRFLDHDLQCRLEGILHAQDCNLAGDEVFEH